MILIFIKAHKFVKGIRQQAFPKKQRGKTTCPTRRTFTDFSVPDLVWVPQLYWQELLLFDNNFY